MTLQIVDRDGHVVRTIVDNEKTAPGDLNFKWDGRDDDGRKLPDGVYRPRIELARHSRQFVLPNPIRIDTVRPRFLGATVSPRVFSPDRDGRREYLIARYQVTEPSKVYVEVNGKQRVESRARPTEGRLQWFGRVGKRPLPAGSYAVRLVAEDRAGNRRASRLLEARVLYIDILRKRARARAGTDFSLRVTTYARRFSWRLGKRRHRPRRPVAPARAEQAGALHALRDGQRPHRHRPHSRRPAVTPPLLVLGVRRSGTTLLRVMLDRHSRARGPGRVVLRPPARRPARRRIDVDAFVDDLRRLPTLRDWDVSRRGRCARAAAGHAPRRGDRRGLRDVRRGARQGPLGRQDADVHAAPRLLERLWPDALLRPPDPRRPGRGAVVPRHAGRDRHEDVGASRRTPRASPASGATEVRAAQALGRAGRRAGTWSCATRSSSRDPERSSADLRLRGPRLRAGDARLRRQGGRLREAAPAEPAPAADAGAARLAERDAPASGSRSKRSPATCCASSATSCRRRTALPAAAGGCGSALPCRRAGWRGVCRALQRSPLWRRRHAPLRDLRRGL